MPPMQRCIRIPSMWCEVQRSFTSLVRYPAIADTDIQTGTHLLRWQATRLNSCPALSTEGAPIGPVLFYLAARSVHQTYVLPGIYTIAGASAAKQACVHGSDCLHDACLFCLHSCVYLIDVLSAYLSSLQDSHHCVGLVIHIWAGKPRLYGFTLWLVAGSVLTHYQPWFSINRTTCNKLKSILN